MHDAGFTDIKIDTIALDAHIAREGMVEMMKHNPILGLFDKDQVEAKLNETMDDKCGKGVDPIPLHFIAHVAIGKKPNL